MKCWSWAVYTSKFFPIHKRDGKQKFIKTGIFEKPRLHFQIFPDPLKSLKTEIFVHLTSNGEDDLSVQHVASDSEWRNQFMIKLQAVKKNVNIIMYVTIL